MPQFGGNSHGSTPLQSSRNSWEHWRRQQGIKQPQFSWDLPSSRALYCLHTCITHFILLTFCGTPIFELGKMRLKRAQQLPSDNNLVNARAGIWTHVFWLLVLDSFHYSIATSTSHRGQHLSSELQKNLTWWEDRWELQVWPKEDWSVIDKMRNKSHFYPLKLFLLAIKPISVYKYLAWF